MNGAGGRGEDPFLLAARLVGIASPSHHEAAIAAEVQTYLESCGGLEVVRIGDNVIARTDLHRPLRLLLAGHLDTVPAPDGMVPKVRGDVLWGTGAADMKGGLAVMLDLARTVPQPAIDLTWCFYAREEVARELSGLDEIWSERPDLLAGDVAILGEPTDALAEAGCQGTMRVVVHAGGVRAHTARPFTGVNAIHRLGRILGRVAAFNGREVDLDGCRYVEQLQAVGLSGGVASNVVPDTASVTLNYRYAPDRSGAGARDALREVFEDLLEPSLGDSYEILDQADGALPSLDHPLLGALVERTGSAPRAKVGWTDVARFASHGIPALNFGPGDPLLAHHADERLMRRSLERARSVLAGLLSSFGTGSQETMRTPVMY